MFFIYFVIWYIVGVYSTIKVITCETDFTFRELPLSIFGGIVGPVMLFIYICTKYDRKVIFKRQR